MTVWRKIFGYEKSKNYCDDLTRTTKKSFFQRVTKNDFATNKKFWNTVKQFLTKKGVLTNDNISIKVNDDLVTDKTKLANLFNLYYISIVENTSGIPPVIQGKPNNPNEDNTTVKTIIKQYQFSNPSIYIFISDTVQVFLVTGELLFVFPDETVTVNLQIPSFGLWKK